MARVIAASPEDPIDPDRIFAALKKLAAKDPRAAQIATLRYCDGMDESEIAGKLNISSREVKRELHLAMAFLNHNLDGGSPE